jgi:hypothetical protein
MKRSRGSTLLLALICCLPTSAVVKANNIVFVTSTTYLIDPSFPGSYNDAGGGSAICQARASAAGLPGHFEPWMSNSIRQASDALLHSSSPYQLVNGTIIANNWADLTDGALAASINRTELNTIPAVGFVWTGTLTGGSYSASDCGSWQSPMLVGTVGQTDRSDSGWTNITTRVCSGSARLYCIQQIGAISGRVTSSGGRAVTHARITITGNSLPNPLVLYTGRDGKYSSGPLSGTEVYTVAVNQRRFTFSPSSRQIPLIGTNGPGTDFTAAQ